MAFTFTDADTGDNILFYLNRGNLWIMVTNPRNGRFIRRTDRISIGVTLTFDYPKGVVNNPIYVDFKMATEVTAEFLMESNPQDLEGVRETIQFIRGRLIERSRERLAELFGERVSALAEVIGIEYKAEPTEETNGQEYPMAHWILIWHHYKADEQEKMGDEYIG